jgi:hypothetical protein
MMAAGRDQRDGMRIPDAMVRELEEPQQQDYERGCDQDGKQQT